MKKFLLFFAFLSVIVSSRAWSMDDGLADLNERTLYKIKLCKGGNVLNAWAHETGKGSTSMAIDNDPPQHASHRLWLVEKHGQHCKFRNFHSGNVLNGWGTETGTGTATMEADVDDRHKVASHRLWYIKKKDNYYKICNYNSGHVLTGRGTEIGKGTSSMEVGADDLQLGANNQHWQFVPVYDKR